MKVVVVVFLLALAAFASARVGKTIENSEDRLSNGYKVHAFALTDFNGIQEETVDLNGYDAGDPDDFNENHEGSEEGATSAYIAGDLTPAVNETRGESEGRITNGRPAYAGQFPYQVFLYIQNIRGLSACGGTLISSQWVLTAAHCTIDAISVDVYLGSTRRYAGTSFTISRNSIINHPGFRSTSKGNDIALIQIPAISLNSPYIQPIKLPSISYYYSSYANQTVTISGWGRTSDNDYFGSTYLHWARLRVISNTVCGGTIGLSLVSSNICVATPGGVSSCFGDSGGPMVLESSKVQIGLSSFGYSQSCESGYPVVYTRITSHLYWIKQNTGIYYT